MPVMMRTIQTALPPTVLLQEPARDVFAAQPGLTRLGQRLIATSFDSAQISTRRTAVAELTLDSRAQDPVFFDRDTGLLLSPSTKVRNEIFAREAGPLFIESARKALDACPDLTAADVTHVITVSCTGFYNPGPDYQVVRGLGLSPSTQRYHLGFMGCYAAFPGLRAAKSFCEADPNAVVLVICVELCSLHVRSSNNPDAIMGSAIFADGAAAAVVTAREYQGAGMRLDHFETILTPVGEESMAWNIGDEGFEMVLGTYVPHIIDDHIVGALEPLLAHDESLTDTYADIPHWGIHPGGRAILDRVQRRLELSDKQLEPARRVLNDYGNMSSATVMFVLKDIMEGAVTGAGPEGERVCSMAFGPGLTVETALMTLLPDRTS
ncbi:type III polyketide synthase [Paeniglutamicibacter cryotolerans]|uniref:Putative naringenin-chalcone synthase n=1 Tax=Paeniglutamicibacter cryotolerans TaxID=670079 RepID=A0A839QR18_9MICC|nr:type III polyketide synthase [Paeniglutamicibacter cryotolerans]MBB2995702.1 putative naringenin-chalcone synthase [Paeniglutamicibacter cryotolerans]